LHLEQVLLKTKKREHELSERVEELEEDLSWHSNQLKIVMKQKNVLERHLQNNMSVANLSEKSDSSRETETKS